jgi:hypothetical protein
VRTIAAILGLLALASCTKKPEISPVERGAQFFAPAADKLGDLVVSDLKASKETWYKEYLKETGAKDDAELGRKIGQGILKECAGAFALTAAQEAALKSGTFADAENLGKVKSAAAKLGPERRAPDAHRIAMAKVESGEWAKGLQLEFVARLLQHQSTKR